MVSICGEIAETDDGIIVFCELESPHYGRRHDVLLTALTGTGDAPANLADRYGEHYSWPNDEPRPRDKFMHNVVAHPLLVLWPRFGRWLHERTEP